MLSADLSSLSVAVFLQIVPLGLGLLSALFQGSFVWFPAGSPVFSFFVSLIVALSVGSTSSVN